MLTLKTITDETQTVINKLKKKNFHNNDIIIEVIETNKKLKFDKNLLDKNFSKLKTLSKITRQLITIGEKKKLELILKQVVSIKKHSKQLEFQIKKAECKLTELLYQIPNLPSEQVPEGKHSKDNIIEKSGGHIPSLSSSSLPHWELVKKYNLIDFELGAKITGSGFPVYKQKGAQLQRALVNFFLDSAREANYVEIQPPYMINMDSAYKTGQLPDKSNQMYCTTDGLYLIPTSEVPVTNIYQDIILDEKDLPIKNTAYSACFRREAGSYGKNVRGLNRLHQFDKVEIIHVDTQEHSYKSLQEMLNYIQNIIEKLELPWRILRLCGGDMSFASALTFDFEVYSAAQKQWLEVSSVSNFESYQANRLKCRYRGKDKKIHLCHTLNGSALALPRIVAAIIENNQTKKGIQIPKVLIPYTRFDSIS
ncbi:MAG: serine--tRNA ligase [Bacteroidales bacterium OttesenSCG-928-I14]|nr:serine--tRNA ligase [Bacteroidales bacterium OttesenSCG-928-I14]